MNQSAWQEAISYIKSQGCKSIHFIGISGVGMRGLAQMMIENGFHVSGSDSNPGAQVKKWANDDLITLYTEHSADHIKSSQWVVYSSAISPHNPELIAGHEIALKVIHRASFLNILASFFKIIAVSGTHGKTTTAAMITHILKYNGLSPSFYIGADSNNEIVAGCGRGDLFVLEADESDQTFLNYSSFLPVITNINYDHFENYPGLESEYEQVFLRFANQNPEQGCVICLGSPGVTKIQPQIYKAVTIGQRGDWQLLDFQVENQRSKATFYHHDRQYQLNLSVPGEHMVWNALTAISAAFQCGVNITNMLKALHEFKPMDRRFQLGRAKDLTIVSDYGHHPLEIDKTIDTARSVWPTKRIVMAFEPHRFSRLKQHFPEFISVLSKVDKLYLLPVYCAGEPRNPDYNSEILANHLVNVECLTSYDMLKDNVRYLCSHNDVLILQGAGRIGTVFQEIAHG